MPLWGVADNDASEPKNLAEGEFQGTAGKRIFGVDNTEMGVVNGKTGDARKYAPAHAVGLEFQLIWICMEILELRQKL